MDAGDIIELKGGGRRFAFAAPIRGGPRLLYWGPDEGAGDIALLSSHETSPLPASPDRRIDRQLFPLAGEGFFGAPALLAEADGSAHFSFMLQERDVEANAVRLLYTDVAGAASLTLRYELDASGLLLARAVITNTHAAALRVIRLCALALPLPRWIDQLDLTYGSWSSEGQSLRIPLAAGKIERTGRSGRPGFDGGPHLIALERTTTETSGGAFGVALAHSGDFSLFAERFGDGDAQLCVSERLQPGEVILKPGDSYETPTAIAALSTAGLTGLSLQFHAFARKLAPQTLARRPVHLNTWEAAYFGVDEAAAMRLAGEAAEIGAERFVLDDGWFRGRNHDRAALGDWTADPAKFPNGLRPLADYIRGRSLEFGLWVEPEMVNEDSDLFRAHPDWILSVDGAPGPTARNQLVLDLAREDVRAYLFDAIAALLRETGAGYLKWDCNRDLFPAATAEGPTTRRHIAGVYALLARIKAAFPDTAIESCASGGGRMDFGVMRHADRFWPSDATDAIERVRIQRRASLFYPVEMLGAHVGPSPNPWTRRALPMAFRCLVAMFGHFGVELDPASLDPHEKEILKRAIALYKELRPIVAGGELLRFDSGEAGLDVQAILPPDRSRAVLRVLRTLEPARPTRAPVRLPGFDAGMRWRISRLVIDGAAPDEPVCEFTSEMLAFAGLDIDPPHAASGALFMMERF